MRSLLAGWSLLLLSTACDEAPADTGPAPDDSARDTTDTGDSADTSDSADSAETAPPNNPPGTASIHMTPAVPAPDLAFSVGIDAEALDPDGDVVTYLYSWTVDGLDADLSGDTVPADRAVLGSVWEVTVTATDGEDLGAPATLLVTVGNAAPSEIAISLAPIAPVEGDDLVLTIDPVAVDPDGDPVVQEITWYKNGTEVTWLEDLTLIEGKWVGDQDEFRVAVTVTDGYHTPQTVEATVTAEYTCANPPPTSLSQGNLSAARAYHGIVFDPSDGTLVGWDGSSLIKSDYAGTRSVFVPGVASVEQMDTLPDGDMVYADNGTGALVRVSSSGATSNITTGLGYVYGVTVGPDGMVYVTYDTIKRVDPDTGATETVYTPSGGAIGTAHAINFNLDSTIMYIATIGNGTVYQMALDANLDPTGRPTAFASGMGSWMDGVEVDECGNLYVPNYSDSMLWRISPDGLTNTTMVTRSSTDYGHGVTWGNGVGGWDEHTLYQPQPYASYHVREVEIGFASGDTVRTWNGVAVAY